MTHDVFEGKAPRHLATDGGYVRFTCGALVLRESTAKTDHLPSLTSGESDTAHFPESFLYQRIASCADQPRIVIEHNLDWHILE